MKLKTLIARVIARAASAEARVVTGVHLDRVGYLYETPRVEGEMDDAYRARLLEVLKAPR